MELLTSENAPPAVKTKIRDLILPALPPWHRSAPREVLVGAVFDACRAVSAAKKFNARLAQDKQTGRKQGEDFARVRFRSRKNPRQTFTVQANCASGKGIYRTKLDDMPDGREAARPGEQEHLPPDTSIRTVPPCRALRREAATSAREPSAGGCSRSRGCARS